MSDSEARLEFVGELGEEFMDRLRRGEHPSLQEYKQRHPDYADEIEELFPALAMMEDLAPQDRESLGLAESGPETRTPELEKLGDFRIIREVGRGGMGVVYEAEQVSLGRHVALKVLPSAALPDGKHVRRFEREAKSAAKLHHTNIVPVFGVGEQDGLHYYVMQFIQGLPLDEVVDELKKIQAQPTGTTTSTEPGQRTGSFQRQQSVAEVAHSLMTGQFAETEIGDSNPEREFSDETPVRSDSDATENDSSAFRIAESLSLSGSLSSSTLQRGKSGVYSDPSKRLTYWQSVANIGAQVADALQYAHEQGILHRDIKPSNLLLDLRGTTWVTDFGLAKATDQQDITHTGDILGTLRYMPPEAFDGLADARSDVYALGLTLYELLVFQPAFGMKERNQLIKQVTTEAAPRLDKLNPQIPRDLVTIVHKAIDRDPAHRYQTAEELQVDLHRFLDDEPIKARRISLTERLARWSRHNKGLAISLATVCVLLLIINIAGPLMTLQLVRTNKQLRIAEAQAAKDAADNERLAEKQTRLAQDKQKLADQLDVSLTKEQQSAKDALSAREKAEQALVSMSAERAVLAAERGQNSEAMLWSAHAAELVPEDSPRRYDNLVRAAHYRRGVMQPVRMFEHPANWVEELAFDPSGRYLLSYSVARGETQPVACRVWDVERGEPLKLPEFSGILTSAAFCSDGRLVALGTSFGRLLLWDLDNGRLVRTVDVDASVQDLAFSEDGRRLGIAAGNSLRVWDVRAEREVMAQPHPDRVLLTALSRNGERITTTCEDRKLRVFECPSEPGQLLVPPVQCQVPAKSLTWHAAPVARPRFVDEGRGVLFLGLSDLRFLDVEQGVCLTSSPGRIANYNLQLREPFAIISHGWYGNSLQTFFEDAEPKLTEISHRRLQPVYSAAFTRNGQEVLTAGGDRFVKSWKAVDGSPGSLELEHSSAVSAICVSPSGNRFATAQQGGLVILWEQIEAPPIAERVQTLLAGGSLVCVSRDGEMFAPTGRTSRAARGDTTQVFDRRTRNPIGRPLSVPGILLDACFSHDGGSLITLSADRYRRSGGPDMEPDAGRLQVWDWRTGKLSSEVKLDAEPRSLDVSADGGLLAVLCTDGTVRTFNPLTALELKQWQAVEPITFNNWYIYNGALRFAPQGRRLVIWNTDHVARVYEADTGAFEYSIEHDGLTRDIAFSADGRLLASSSGFSAENDCRVTDFATGQLLADPVSHPDWVFGLAFNTDGTLLATACRDSTARIWNWREGKLHLPPLEHDNEVHAVSYSPDGRFVISTGDDEQVRVWSAADGKPIIPPQPLSGMGWSIRWAGTTAVIAGDGPDQTVLDLERLGEWDDRSVSDVVRLCELTAGRHIEAGGESQLTTAEWLDRYRLSRAALPQEFQLDFDDAFEETTVQATDAPLREMLAQHWRRVPTIDSAEIRRKVIQYIQAGELQEAARQIILNLPNNYLYDLKLASILVDNGLLDEYQQLCELGLKAYSSSSSPFVSQQIAEMCLLSPNAVSDLEKVRRLSDSALILQDYDIPAEFKEQILRRSQMVRGLMALREGDYEATIKWSRRAREGLDESKSGWSVPGYIPSVIVEALAQLKAGHEDEAEKLLSSPYVESAAQWPVEPDQGARSYLHSDLLLSRILLREAERVPTEPDDTETLIQRGKLHALLGHFSSAAESYQRSLELNPDNQLITCYRTFLLVALDDAEGIAAARRTLIERWGTIDENVNAITAERTAKAYLLAPESGPGLERACALADLSVERGTGNTWEPAFWLVKALAEYRRGNDEEVLVWTQRLAERKTFPDEWLPIAARFLAAMAQHRLGQTSAAHRELESARKDFDRRIHRGIMLPTALWDPDDVVCLILQREAVALIEHDSFDETLPSGPVKDSDR